MRDLTTSRIRRAVALVLSAAQILVAVPIAAQSPQPPSSVAVPAKEAERPVKINRTVPRVTPPPALPLFSDPPTAAEITRARVFEEPLLALGASAPSPDENHVLAGLLTTYLKAGVPDGTRALEAFVAEHADSPWRASLLTDLGTVWRRTGHFSKAYAAWQTAWQQTKDVTDPHGRAVADKALGEFVELSARLGQFDELTTLFADIRGRDIHGSATEKVSGAKQAVWLMKNEPAHSFRCGPLGLDAVLRAGNPRYQTPDAIRMCPSTKRGTSLAGMRDLAKEVGVSMVMAQRPPGAAVIVPALVHWKVGHFAALVEKQGDQYLLKDPTFGDELWLTQTALDEEASGSFLVRMQTLPAGWRALSEDEGGRVWGKGQVTGTNARDPGRPPLSCPAPSANGMAVVSLNAMTAATLIDDTPLWYTPPVGPAIAFSTSYNQRDVLQPQTFSYVNLGPKWTFDWLSFVTDNPSNLSAAVTLYLRGGGEETASNFNAGTQSYAPTLHQVATLTRVSTSPIRYERQLGDGSIEVFGQPDGASAFPRRVFLTAVKDPHGNALTFTYDGSLRLAGVTDAIGQVTTFAYTNADPLKITQVTDPFGRTATFNYDGTGRLQAITDLLGLTSSFTYGPNDSIIAVQTPYGTTSINVGDAESSFKRWVEITDPIGGRERVEFGSATVFTSEPRPGGMLTIDNNNHHNSSYWGKRAMEVAPADPASATDYYWSTTQDGGWVSSASPTGIKAPLENRVWYAYPGTALIHGGPSGQEGLTEGSMRRPAKIGRVLDDGTSQVSSFAYNTLGNITQAIDPVGRETDFVYDSTGRDLLQVKQKRGGTFDILETRTYTGQHEPLTVIDAAGQTTTYTYNAAGQALTLTNAKNETITYAYNSSGYLTTISGPVSGATVTFGYDGYGRVNSVTDSEGYAMTTLYDVAGRATQVTYPDGTYEQTVYDRLHPQRQRDRRGRWTTFTHNAALQLVSVRDPLGRVVSLDRCGCGSLEAFVDSNGNRTRWSRDVEGRVTTETRADGLAAHYTYETTSSRLKQVTDRKGQLATYTYFLDDSFKQKVYTNATIQTPTVSFTYDPSYFRLATMTDGTGTTTYGYHSVANGHLGAGQLASVDGPLSNDTISYTYDELGRGASHAINGATQTVTYDALARIMNVTNVLGTFTYAYIGNSGRFATVAYPNGQTSTFTYFGHTGDDRLQTILHKRADNSTISRFDYAFDAIGNSTTWTRQFDANAPTVYQFGYDAADQIVDATRQTTGGTPTVLARYRYNYDRAGNRTSEQIDDVLVGASHDNVNAVVSTQPTGGLYFAGTVNEPSSVTIAGKIASVAADGAFNGTIPVASGTNTLTIAATDVSGNTATKQYQVSVSGNVTTLTYDSNGNLTSDGTRAFTWDAEDRLISVGSGNHTSTFTYDGLGRRVRRVEVDNSTTTSDTRLVWCGSAICETRDSAGANVIKRYFALGVQDSGTAYYYTLDHLGSVRELTDSTNAVRARYDYDLWGQRTKVAGDVNADFGFSATYHHDAAGLEFANHRAYDAKLGRWLSRDPLQELGGINLYAYADNNPTNRIDPLGLWSPEAHDSLLAAAFFNVVPHEKTYLIQQASRDFDRKTQGSESANLHSMMRSDQTPEQAIEGRDRFIMNMINAARQMRQSCREAEALTLLGMALHPVMDSTSPKHNDAHGNPKVWYNVVLSGWGHSPGNEKPSIAATGYEGGETPAQLTPMIYAETTRKIMHYYNLYLQD